MSLTNQQLETLLARALPDERLREARRLQDGRYVLALAGGERLNVQTFESAEAAATTMAALRLLRAEVDLPIPQLRAGDSTGATVGVPYALLSEVGGEPLAQALARISDEQLYDVGRRLGEVICRVHRLMCERYGSLAVEDPGAAEGERGYVLARLAQDLRRCGERGLLDRRAGAEISAWFERAFQPAGRQPALVCGGLRPATIMVRQSAPGWRISVGSSRVDLQACKLEYSIVSPK